MSAVKEVLHDNQSIGRLQGQRRFFPQIGQNFPGLFQQAEMQQFGFQINLKFQYAPL